MKDNQTLFVRSIYAEYICAQENEAILFSVKYSEKGHNRKFYNESFCVTSSNIYCIEIVSISMNIIKLNSAQESLSRNCIRLAHSVLCSLLQFLNINYDSIFLNIKYMIAHFQMYYYPSTFPRNAVKSHN